MIEAYFPKTIALLKAANLTTVLKDPSAVSNKKENDAAILFAESITKDERIVQSNHHELLQEVIAYELEKYTLKDTLENLDEIAQKEQLFNQQREVLLTTRKNDVTALFFEINPFVNIYMSHYKIVWDVSKDTCTIVDNLEKTPEEHYYLFQRIDIHDAYMNNVLEFPLTKYECFVLQLFETPKKYTDALHEFTGIFEYETSKEQQIIEANFQNILTRFIYRKFLVEATSSS